MSGLVKRVVEVMWVNVPKRLCRTRFADRLNNAEFCGIQGVQTGDKYLRNTVLTEVSSNRFGVRCKVSCGQTAVRFTVFKQGGSKGLVCCGKERDKIRIPTH